MYQLLQTLPKNRRLLKDFVVRDLKARYVGSSMGFFWSVIFPIINLFVYMFVFTLVIKARWGDQMGPKEVSLIMLSGIVVWNCFAEAVSRSANTLVDNANLIQKVVFPSEILPLYIALSCLINMIIALPVVLAAVAYFKYIAPFTTPEMIADPNFRPLLIGPALLSLPILFLLQTMFTVGIGYFLATLNIFWRDTFHLVGVFIVVWMFSTPIFYPAALVEDSGYGIMLDINPMYWLIDEYRNVLVYGAWPRWLVLGKFTVAAVAALFLGSRFFMAQKQRFPDLL